MSEPKRPFEAATLCLGASRCMFNNQGQVEISNAIRVLEAAGKVDKKRLADGLEELWGVYMDERGFYGDMEKIVGDMDALLEALPDKEEK